MLIRLRSERGGGHVHTRMFVGVDADHLQLTGTFCMDAGQWGLFNNILEVGADEVRGMHGNIVFESPDELSIKVTAAEAKEAEKEVLP